MTELEQLIDRCLSVSTVEDALTVYSDMNAWVLQHGPDDRLSLAGERIAMILDAVEDPNRPSVQEAR